MNYFRIFASKQTNNKQTTMETTMETTAIEMAMDWDFRNGNLYRWEHSGYGFKKIQNAVNHNVFRVQDWQFDEWRELMDENCGYLEHTEASNIYMAEVENARKCK